MKNNIDYLRISLTDRCNLRCCYCIPESGLSHSRSTDILTFQEIIRIVKAFVSLGGNKVRLTGGEPLLREGIVDLVKNLRAIEGLEEICLTTNGILLSGFASALKNAGLSRINISLDTLRSDKFTILTKQTRIKEVFSGIKEAKRAGFTSIKLNVVVMKGINDDEIIDFIKFAIEESLIVRFIEFMKVTPLWEEKYFLPIENIIELCNKNFIMKRIGPIGSSPCEYYRVLNNFIGFIKTKEENCNRCSRLRLTSDGKLKLCIYEKESSGIKEFLDEYGSDGELKKFIQARMNEKRKVNYMDFGAYQNFMSSIGG